MVVRFAPDLAIAIKIIGCQYLACTLAMARGIGSSHQSAVPWTLDSSTASSAVHSYVLQRGALLQHLHVSLQGLRVLACY